MINAVKIFLLDLYPSSGFGRKMKEILSSSSGHGGCSEVPLLLMPNDEFLSIYTDLLIIRADGKIFSWKGDSGKIIVTDDDDHRP